MPRGVNAYDEAQHQGRLWHPGLAYSKSVLKGWWDVSPGNFIGTGGNVTSVKDLSGNGVDATSTLRSLPPALTIEPYTGRHAVFFNSTVLNADVAVSGTVMTVIAAATMTASSDTSARLASMMVTAGGADWNGTDRAAAILRTSNISNVGAYRNGGALAALDITANVPFTVASRWDGSNHYCFVNGLRSTSFASTGTFGITTMSWGRADGTGEKWNGHAFGLLVFAAALTDYEVARAEGYLAWRYGFRNRLARAQQFRERPPLIGD